MDNIVFHKVIWDILEQTKVHQTLEKQNSEQTKEIALWTPGGVFAEQIILRVKLIRIIRTIF